MKILLEGLSLLPPRTGIGRYTKQLIQGLLQQPTVEAVDVLISAFPLGNAWRNGKSAIQECVSNSSIALLPFPYGITLRLWDRLRWPKVDRFHRQYSIVHGPNYILPPVKNAAGILTVHDLSLVTHPEWYPTGSQALIPRIRDSVYRANAIIVPSQSIYRAIHSLYPGIEDCVHVVPYDLITPFRVCSSKEKNVVRRNLFGSDFPYLFWVGEINPRKNVALLLRTLALLRQKGNRDIRLVMAGPIGFRSEEIQALIKELRLIIHTGTENVPVPEADVVLMGYLDPEGERLKNLYAAADLFLFPSWDEGFGFPLLESMASGIPVVASSLGSIPEVVGDSAVLIDPGEGPEPFVDAIENLMHDSILYNHYQTLGLQRVQVFRDHSMAARIVQIYQQTLDDGV